MTRPRVHDPNKTRVNPLVRILAVRVLNTVILYGMLCTKHFVHMKRYFDYFTTIPTFL